MRRCINAPRCPNPAADGTALGILNEDGTEPGYLSCAQCIAKEAKAHGVPPWGVAGAKGEQGDLFGSVRAEGQGAA